MRGPEFVPREWFRVPLSVELILAEPWYCFAIIDRELRHRGIEHIEYRAHEDCRFWGSVVTTFEAFR
jgi:hypothetical protein